MAESPVKALHDDSTSERDHSGQCEISKEIAPSVGSSCLLRRRTSNINPDRPLQDVRQSGQRHRVRTSGIAQIEGQFSFLELSPECLLHTALFDVCSLN